MTSPASNDGVPVQPSPLNPEPSKFALSGPFAALLREFVIEARDGDGRLFIVHDVCGDEVCEVEDDDVFDILICVVIGHDCP